MTEGRSREGTGWGRHDLSQVARCGCIVHGLHEGPGCKRPTGAGHPALQTVWAHQEVHSLCHLLQ